MLLIESNLTFHDTSQRSSHMVCKLSVSCLYKLNAFCIEQRIKTVIIVHSRGMGLFCLRGGFFERVLFSVQDLCDLCIRF